MHTKCIEAYTHFVNSVHSSNNIYVHCSRECVYFMVDFHLNAGGNKVIVVHKKYSDPFFGYVAFLSPAKLFAEDNSSPNN